MNDLQSLLNAAKADAPSAAARAKVWAGVSSVVGGATALSSGGAAAGSLAAGKMLVLGALLGGTLTVGIGAALLFVGRPPTLRSAGAMAAPAGPEGAPELSAAAPAAMPVQTATMPVAIAIPAPPALSEGAAPIAVAAVEAGKRFPSSRSAAGARTGKDDALAREASLLVEARDALVRHDSLSALQIVRRLRSLPAPQLVPEELAVEAQALRGLGLDDEAEAVEAALRSRFPDSALGR